MNILFVHPRPARISYKHMTALSKVKGINVYLLCGNLGPDVLHQDIRKICREYVKALPLAKIPFLYKTYRKVIKKYVQKWGIDLIQTYSEPDDAAVAAVESKVNVPIVFCNRDNVSAYSKELLATRIVPRWIAYNRYLGWVPREILYKYILYLEKKAHEKSDGRMYISPGMMEYSSKLHDINGNNLVFTDWVLDEELPITYKKKLSEGTDDIHIGFSGGIIIHDAYRNHLPFLNKLAKGKIHVHMHIVTRDEKSRQACREAVKKNRNLHLYEEVLPAREFIEQLSSYDWGIIPFETEWRYVDTLLTNKIYDYISAKIPVISCNAKTLKRYINENRLGFIYKDISDLREKLKKQNPLDYTIDPSKFLISKNIHKVIKFYEKIIDEYHNNKNFNN